MVKSIIKAFVIVAALAYAIIWVFNHINPWLSVALAIGSIYGATMYFEKKTKQ